MITVIFRGNKVFAPTPQRGMTWRQVVVAVERVFNAKDINLPPLVQTRLVMTTTEVGLDEAARDGVTLTITVRSNP